MTSTQSHFTSEHTYTTKQIAELVGVTTRTLYRWLAEEHIREPERQPHSGHRHWSETDLHAALLYRNTGIRSGAKQQIDLLSNQTEPSP